MNKLILLFFLFSIPSFAQTNKIYQRMINDKFVTHRIDEKECKKGIEKAISLLSKGNLAYRWYGHYGGYEKECIENYFLDSMNIDFQFIGCVVTSYDVGFDYVMKPKIEQKIQNDLKEFLDMRNFYCKTANGYRPSVYVGFDPALKKILFCKLSSFPDTFSIFVSSKIDTLGRVKEVSIQNNWGKMNLEAERIIKETLINSKFYPRLIKGIKKESEYNFHFNYYYDPKKNKNCP